MIFLYQNGSFGRAIRVGSEKYELLENAIHLAKCEGFPFRGNPLDMANNAISQIRCGSFGDIGFFPVILESRGGCDNKGNYTTEVIFQIVNPF